MAPVAWGAIIALGFGFGTLIAGPLRLVERSRLAVAAPQFVGEAGLTGAQVPNEDIAGYM